jgi:hypothetical protein
MLSNVWQGLARMQPLLCYMKALIFDLVFVSSSMGICRGGGILGEEGLGIRDSPNNFILAYAKLGLLPPLAWDCYLLLPRGN